jgi:hypothetical protein
MKKNKNVLNEAFNWGVRSKKNPKTGGRYFVAYIDGSNSENAYPYRQELAKRGAKWNGVDKCWYIALPEDPDRRQEYIETKVKPIVEYLKSVEKDGTKDVDSELQGIIAKIDELIQKIDDATVKGDTIEVNTAMDPKEIKRRLESFKEELLASFKDEGWKEKMLPIIKYRKAQGAKFSLLNSILIKMQDPDATMVKSRGNWGKANREVKDNAPVLYGWRPNGTPLFPTAQDKKMAKEDWLRKNRKTEANLTVGEKEILNRYIYQLDQSKPIYITLEPIWYDIRFTTQMEGKEDLVGSNDIDFEWFDGKTPESEKSAKLYDALIQVIQKAKIRITYGGEDELGSARGVSKSGEIMVLKDSPKDVGSVSTLVHEFSHELLHQKYLSKEDKTGLGEYFIGTAEGRGMVEQQAEISAWIVMRNFGYNMTAARNYVSCWGGSAENCVRVFDTVANVASLIIQDMEEVLDRGVNEQRYLKENAITGEEIAMLLGGEAEKTYKKGKLELQQKEITENFNSFFSRMEKSGKDCMTKNMFRL